MVFLALLCCLNKSDKMEQPESIIDSGCYYDGLMVCYAALVALVALVALAGAADLCEAS
jgi:hypothetical protein